MPITAQSIIRRVVDEAQDNTSVRWPLNELVRYLNDGQREVLVYRPDAMVLNAALVLATGSKQALPANGSKLIEVVRNTGGTKRPVRLVNREILDAQLPGWHALTGVTEILHYTYDPRDPRTFYVYPPATNAASLDIVYAALPTDIVEPASGASLPTSVNADGIGVGTASIGTTVMTVTAMTSGAFGIGQVLTGTGVAAGTTITALGTGIGGVGTYTVSASQTVGSTTITGSPNVVTGNIGVNDIYGNVLQDYVLYRAYMKDSEYAGNAQRAGVHYGAFANALGIEIKATLAVAPRPTGNPNARTAQSA